MPKASAPEGAMRRVWLSPQTDRHAGLVMPCSGPMMWTMPWRMSSTEKYGTPNSRKRLRSSVSTCWRDSGSTMPFLRSVVGML